VNNPRKGVVEGPSRGGVVKVWLMPQKVSYEASEFTGAGQWMGHCLPASKWLVSDLGDFMERLWPAYFSLNTAIGIKVNSRCVPGLGPFVSRLV